MQIYPFYTYPDTIILIYFHLTKCFILLNVDTLYIVSEMPLVDNVIGM